MGLSNAAGASAPTERRRSPSDLNVKDKKLEVHDLENARMIAVNSGDIQQTMENLIDEVERLNGQLVDFAKDDYHPLAMRTAAGNDVFHWPPLHYVKNWGAENPQLQNMSREGFHAAIIEFLRAADAINRWKSVLFYNKDPNPDGFFRDFTEIDHHDFDPAKVTPQLIHAMLGIAAEAGELVEDAARAMCGEELDANINRESGDIDWYQELLALVSGQSTDENRRQNIARLQKRFPEKFSEDDAITRADEA